MLCPVAQFLRLTGYLIESAEDIPFHVKGLQKVTSYFKETF